MVSMKIISQIDFHEIIIFVKFVKYLSREKTVHTVLVHMLDIHVRTYVLLLLLCCSTSIYYIPMEMIVFLVHGY